MQDEHRDIDLDLALEALRHGPEVFVLALPFSDPALLLVRPKCLPLRLLLLQRPRPQAPASRTSSL